MKKICVVLIVGLLVCLVSGCGTPQSCIVVTNNTGIALSVKENPQTQMYEVWMGYVNSVFGIVPTNRGWSDKVPAYGEGAKDTGNVLFETNFTNWFCFWNSNGIYQRVAVGDAAVTQPGAMAMFAKNDKGNIDSATVSALSNVVTYSNNKGLLDAKSQLIELCKDVNNKAKAIVELKKLNMTWDQFIDNTTMPASQVTTITNIIKGSNAVVLPPINTNVDSGVK